MSRTAITTLIVAPVLLCAVLYALLLRARGVVPVRADPVGRYVLVEGHFSHASLYTQGDKQFEIPSQGIFKIDTVTGKTWLYSSVAVDGKDDSTWQPIQTHQ